MSSAGHHPSVVSSCEVSRGLDSSCSLAGQAAQILVSHLVILNRERLKQAEGVVIKTTRLNHRSPSTTVPTTWISQQTSRSS